MKLRMLLLSFILLVVSPRYSNAAIMTYTDQSDFAADAPNDFKLIDLEVQPTITSVNSLDLTGFGVTFFGPNALIAGSQNGQTEGDHDRLIANGSGFHGLSTPHIGLNFSQDFDGVGAWSNFIDGGRIQLFSELNGGGILLGEAPFGGGNSSGGNFGGIITSQDFKSAIITCDFNFDLRCGVFDIQFGSAIKTIPEPLTLLGAGTAAMFGTLFKRKVTKRKK